MTVITTGSNPKLLWPGLNKIWGDAYFNEHKEEYTHLFDKDSSSQSYEEDQLMTGMGLVPQKSEGASVSYDTQKQSYTTRYTNVAYALGFIVTREEIADNLYLKVGGARTRQLAFSFRQTKENVAANVYNRAFNSSFTGGDGVELISTSHVTEAGNQSNRLTVAADLSEASLEDLVIQIMKAKNERGLRISLMPTKLIVPVDLHFEAQRILMSSLQSGTANNDVNALYTLGSIPEIVTNHYLTDSDAFFVRTNVAKNTGLKCYQREEIQFSRDNDFDTDNLKAKGYERYSFGWTDWRGVYGSPG